MKIIIDVDGDYDDIPSYLHTIQIHKKLINSIKFDLTED
jgi:hypothetical protein